jgi:hypothetical protein
VTGTVGRMHLGPVSDAVLRRLVDRSLIEETLYRYASSIDLGDDEALRSTLTDDVVAVYGDRAPIVGADQLVQWITEHGADRLWQHHLLNVFHVDIDGDEASALTYHTSHQAAPDDPHAVKVIVARYHDRLRRVAEDRWSIASKQMDVLWRETRRSS